MPAFGFARPPTHTAAPMLIPANQPVRLALDCFATFFPWFFSRVNLPKHTRDDDVPCKEIVSSNLLENCRMNSILYTDGCLGGKKAAKTSYPYKRFAVRSVIQKKSEWTKTCKVNGKKKLAGTQALDRTRMWLKQILPQSMKNRGNNVLNPRI